MVLLIIVYVLQANQNGDASKGTVWFGSTFINLMFACKRDEGK
jgi:hypothetical protein